jgi:alkaline phosphatase
MLSKGIKEGKYGGDLAIDDMPNMALISTAGSDSIITDSANSMSAYTTGHKSCMNALGVYCARNKGTLDHPKVETIAELIKRRNGMAIGVVTNTEIEDATPAGMVAHTRRRGDFNDIVAMFYASQPEVMLGGGTPYFLPKSKPGSKRDDDTDYIAKFQDAGYVFASTLTELKAAAAANSTTKVLGLFNNGNIDGALDRRVLKKGTVSRYPDQPDLVDQTKIAIGLLSRSDKGFMLMVESGRIDKYSHSLDWERAVYDTIMLDNAVQAAKDWAGNRNDTLIVIVPDHAHPVSIIGTYDDDRPGKTLRDQLGIYADAKFPNYPAPDKDGYPERVDVSRRIAMSFGAYPDHLMASSSRQFPAVRTARHVSPTNNTARRQGPRASPATCRLRLQPASTRPTMCCSRPWVLVPTFFAGASTTRPSSASSPRLWRWAGNDKRARGIKKPARLGGLLQFLTTRLSRPHFLNVGAEMLQQVFDAMAQRRRRTWTARACAAHRKKNNAILEAMEHYVAAVIGNSRPNARLQ